MSMYGFNPFLYTMGQSTSWAGSPSSTDSQKQNANDPFAFSSMPGFFNAPVTPTVTAPMPAGVMGGLNLSGGLPNVASTNAALPALPANLTSTGTGSTTNVPATNNFSAADLSKMGVTSSVLTCMSQVNSMVSNVCQGLGPFVSKIVNDPMNQPGAYSGTSGGYAGDASYTGPPGTREGQAINWALGEEQKGISEAKDNAYIVKNYSNGTQEAWCADFVSTAFEKTGGSPWGHISSVAGIRAWGEKNNRYFSKGSGKTPQPGDVIVFQGDGISHVGIVTKVENGKVYTIEGNTSDAVHSRSYSLNDSKITGYVRPFGSL